MGVRTALTMTGFSMGSLPERPILAAALGILREPPKPPRALRSERIRRRSPAPVPLADPRDVHARLRAEIEHVLERRDGEVRGGRIGQADEPPRDLVLRH